MAKNDGIYTDVGIKGDREYKAALQGISRQLAVLNSDMKASQSAFGDQAESTAGMQDKLEKLNAIYDAQAKRVDIIREKLERAKESEDTSQKTIDELTIALNRATAQMNETGNKISATEQGLQTLAQAQALAGDETDAANMTLKEAEAALKAASEGAEEMAGASEEAGGAASDVGDAAEDASGGVGGFAEALGAAGQAVAGAFLGGVEAALGALQAIGGACADALGEAFGLAQDAGKYADDLVTLSTQIGVDTDSLQQWQYASNFIDTSVDTITGSMTKLTKAMGEAQDGNEATQEKFRQLGVSWEGVGGQLRDSEDVFMDAIDALGKIQNPAERDAAAMELFGKSAKELNPLIEAGSEAWREMGKEAEAMGTVFSEENLNKMGSFDDSMQRMNATGQALANSIGLVVIPAFQPLVDAAAGAMGEVSKALQEGASPEEVEALLNGVLDSFSEALTGVGQMIEESLPVITEVVNRVLQGLSDALPGLLEVLLPGAIALIQGLGTAIAENAEAVGELAATVMTAIGTALVTALPKIIEKLPEVFQGIYEGLTGSDFNWSGLGGEILGHIVEGLSGFGEKVKEIFTGGRDEAIKVDWDGVRDDLKDVAAQLINLAPKALSAGLEGAYGIIEGLNWNALGETIGHIASGLIGLAGEAIAAPLQAGYGFIKDLDWTGMGETLAAVPNGLMKVTDEAISKAFETGFDTIEKLNWSGLSDVLAAVPNGLISLSGKTLSGAFSAAYDIIDGIPWDELGNEIADGLGRAWGIVSGVGDVALGIGEAGVAAGQQGVAALKAWIASWGEDGSVETEAAAAGEQVVADLGTGVSDAVPDLEETAQAAANALLDAIRGVWVDTTVQKIGEQLDDDIETGMVLGEDDLLMVAEALAWDAFDAVENAVELADFAEIGRQMDNGIVSGINENSRYIQEAARSAANAAYAAAKAELGIASPSKKGAWLGEMFDLGFAGGLRENADEIESAMGYLNDLAVAEAAPAVISSGYARQQAAFEMDYARVKEAFVEAIEETGVGYTVMQMDKEIVGQTVEPATSRATRQRQQRSVKGRTSRLII